MKKGDIVRITTQCVPNGIVPNRHAILLYKYSNEYNGKWYAIEKNIEIGEDIQFDATVDSHRIFLLKPELEN